MRKMLINKIGYSHLQEGINCQDFGIETPNVKVIADGCSQCKHSEVGAKTFCHKVANEGLGLVEALIEMNELFNSKDAILGHMLFTSLALYENENDFTVAICGDGYIIKERYDGTIEYDKFDFDNAPPYYFYNFIDPKYLSKYKDGVDFQILKYSKTEYKSIGISTDGIQFILDGVYKEEFETYLRNRQAVKIKLLINKVNMDCLKGKLAPIHSFKDDITIII
jgi:hypothetical protein